MNRPPCFDHNPCPDRKMACHGQCERYQKWAKENREQNDKRCRQKSDMIEYKDSVNKRMGARMGWKKNGQF